MDTNLPANPGDTVSIPGLGRFHMPWSMHHTHWACVLPLLKPVYLEPVLHNRGSRRSEKPVTARRSGPCWPQVEKAQAKQQRPRADKMQEVVKSWEPQGKGWLYRKWWKFGSIKADYHYEQDHTLIQHVHNSTKSWRKQCFWNLDRFGFTSWLCSWFAQFC